MQWSKVVLILLRRRTVTLWGPYLSDDLAFLTSKSFSVHAQETKGIHERIEGFFIWEIYTISETIYECYLNQERIINAVYLERKKKEFIWN